jgi:cytolysin-activating lysine-acyltransferase
MVDQKDDKSSKGAKAPDGNGAKAAASAARMRARRPADARQARFGQAFSQIIAVLMRDQNFKNMRIADLEWLVLPPVMAGQFRLAHMPAPQRGTPAPKAGDGPEKPGVLIPVAVALWARVSPQIDKGLSENLDKAVRLRPNQWASGNIPWLIAVAGDRRAIPKFLERLKEAEFKGQEVKMRASAGEGKVVVKTL